MDPDRAAAMEAFRERALRRSPIPVPGVSPAPGGAPRQPTPAGGGQPPQAGEETEILKQVAGEVTQPELIEVLISRLKNLLPKKGEQGGTTNVTA